MDMSVAHGSVVVGVDGSPDSALALAWAVRQAARDLRHVTLVHACGVPGPMDGFEDLVAAEEGRRAAGRAIVRKAHDQLRATRGRVGVESLVAAGHPEVVLSEASETAAMVVVGARGRSAVGRSLLGKVSTELAHEAHCPVVVVREATALDEGPVVLGVDGTPASTAAIEFAFHLASTRRLPLIVMHATWDREERDASVIATRSYAAMVDRLEQEGMLLADVIASVAEKYPDVTVTEDFRSGDPVRHLVGASERASVVVVGIRARGRFHTNLRTSVSHAVAERAECPVVVVRP